MNMHTTKTYLSPDQIFPFFAVAVGLVCMLAIADLSQLFLFTLVAVAVFFVGIPHGALDVIVIEKYCLKQLPFQSSLLKRVFLYGVYLLIVLVCLFFWQSSPFLGLLTFYALAIGHFQEDWFELNHFLARMCLASILLSASVWLYSDNLTSLFMLLGKGQNLSFACRMACLKLSPGAPCCSTTVHCAIMFSASVSYSYLLEVPVGKCICCMYAYLFRQRACVCLCMLNADTCPKEVRVY